MRKEEKGEREESEGREKQANQIQKKAEERRSTQTLNKEQRSWWDNSLSTRTHTKKKGAE